MRRCTNNFTRNSWAEHSKWPNR